MTTPTPRAGCLFFSVIARGRVTEHELPADPHAWTPDDTANYRALGDLAMKHGVTVWCRMYSAKGNGP